jgi:hypothetical protein
MFMVSKYCIEEIMNLGSEKFIKDDGQDITRNKTGKKQFCRQGPGVFNHRSEEILHVLVLLDDWIPVELSGAIVYCSRIREFVYRIKMRKVYN